MAALVALYAELLAVRWEEGVAGLGAAGGLVLLAGLVRARAAWIPVSALLLGAAYGLAVVSRDPVFDRSAVAVAALLLLVAEVGLWACELAAPIRRGSRLLVRRAVLITILAASALAAAGFVAAVASQEPDASLLLIGLGAAAAAAVVGLLARLSRTGR